MIPVQVLQRENSISVIEKFDLSTFQKTIANENDYHYHKNHVSRHAHK